MDDEFEQLISFGRMKKGAEMCLTFGRSLSLHPRVDGTIDCLARTS